MFCFVLMNVLFWWFMFSKCWKIYFGGIYAYLAWKCMFEAWVKGRKHAADSVSLSPITVDWVVFRNVCTHAMNIESKWHSTNMNKSHGHGIMPHYFMRYFCCRDFMRTKAEWKSGTKAIKWNVGNFIPLPKIPVLYQSTPFLKERCLWPGAFILLKINYFWFQKGLLMPP